MSTTTEQRTRPSAGEIEERALDTLSADPKRLRGLIPYGVESRDLGGWKEVIEPGALNNAKLDDLIATVDHKGLPLGRYPTTLQLEDRSDGLHWSIEPPESRADVREAVERGDLRAGSWRMVVGRDEWRGDVRHVHEIAELRDVAVATNPAYNAAAVELRTKPETSAIADTEAASERQEDSNMTETTLKEAPEAAVEERTEERAEGGLQVEERSDRGEQLSVEDRVVEALRGVRKGESRSLSLSSADAITPPEISAFLFQKLRASSVALQSGIVVIPTDRKEITWPKLSADVDPDWYEGGEKIDAGDPTLVSLTAEPKKLAHIVQVENEVIDDSEPSVVDVLNQHLGVMLGLKLDLGVFEGDPENPKSITGMASVEGVQHGDLPADYDPFIEAVGMLQDANAPGPYVAVGPPSVFTALALLKDKNENQLAPPKEMPTVFTSTQLTNTFVYSPSQIVLVRRKDAEIELDRSRLFNEDESEVRGKARADLLLPNPEAVVVLDGENGS